MWRYAIPGFLFAMAMSGGNALAQDAEPERYGPYLDDWEFVISGTGSNDKEFEQGEFGFNAELGNYFTENLLVGVRQGVNWSGGSDVSDRWNGATRVAGAYHFDMGQWRPFIGANLGYKYGGSGFNDTWTVGPEAGVKWYAKERTFVMLRVAFDSEFDRFRRIDDDFERGTFNYVLGVGYNF